MSMKTAIEGYFERKQHLYGIEANKKELISNIPNEYYELFNDSGCLVIEFINNRELIIWDIDEIRDNNEGYMIEHFMPNSIALGSTGSGECFVYVKSKGFGFVSFGDLDENEVYFLKDGIEKELNNPDVLTKIYGW